MTVPTTSNGAAEHREERGLALLAVHRPVRYRESEQRFSTALQGRLDQLLEMRAQLDGATQATAAAAQMQRTIGALRG